MDGCASGRWLQRCKTRKTAAEWQLPVSGLASAVVDVLSGGGRAKRVLAVVADGSAAGGCWAAAAEGWFVGLGWWLMACVGSFFLSFFSSSFFFFLFFFVCGLWVVVAGFFGSWCGASTVAKIDRWGLLVVGSKGFGWRVTFWWLDTCGYWDIVFWCGLVEMSWRDFEGGVVAGFLVVENIRWKFFLSGSGLTCDDASNGSVFALIPKLTQDNQNKTETTEK